ncbi:hypothetical protein CFC21_014233 [Triticum aestivum]|uniref:DDE Tnp4 domain-containing protein n=2 Tax=Triticum aestivum TaxID=4565 RepID=A0A3B6A413_WHEAT|nr:hypothetical protein CFC21_014233 [Triticum aestivum]
MPNRRRKREPDDGGGAAAAAGAGGAGADESKRDLDLRITNILAEYHAPRPTRRALPLLELNGRVLAEEDEEGEAEVVSPLTAPAPALPVVVVDGRPSKRRVVAGGGGGGDEASPYQRRLWVKDRSSEWWELRSSPGYPEAEFLREFRMGRATFGMVCDALGAAVAKEDTALRAAIPVRQRVAVCVWRLATGEPLRLVSKRFGIGISTCHKLVLEVCAAIRSILMPRFLRWPDRGSAASAAVKASFEASSGVPDVVGAMYTTHIPIIAPKVHVASYFNRRHTERNQKTSYSITLQGVVGPDATFTDVCIGWPGSLADDQVLDKSALQQRAAAGMMEGSWVVGGASYPLTDWCLVPYTHQNLTWTQHAFNEKVAQLRDVAVDAFSRLKSRWACLQKRTEVKLQDLPVVLGACCVLHNICEARGEAMPPELRVEVEDDLAVLDNPVRSDAAAKARDKIAHNLLHRGLAGTAFF